MFKRIIRSLKRDGACLTALKCLWWPGRKLAQLRNRYLQWRLDNTKNHKTAFELIYRLNTWDSAESVSGPGSTFAYTRNLRERLPQMFEEHGIRSVFDAPCGDFNWMPSVLASSPVNYIGADIVRPLIANHRKKFAGQRTDFRLLDITRDAFPQADLWICRDCLVHLSYRQIIETLSNFARSNIRFALLTNHRNRGDFHNENIDPGEFRRMDLFSPPFSFSEAVLCRIEEDSFQETGHEMCLWTREQIAACLPALGRALENG
jgi:hypothetical protein